MVLARTGGRPQQWVRTARPDFVQEEASSRRKRRRKQAISTFRQTAAGGHASASVQAHDEGMFMMQKTAIRQKLLEEAGIKAGAPPGSGLALKSNVGITWRQLRKIRRWFKSFGLKFPDTEGRMRAANAKQQPPYSAELLPMEFIKSKGNESEVRSSPAVFASNICQMVIFWLEAMYIHSLFKTHGHIPDDEEWLKFGGDHGGGSMKFCL